MAEPTRDTDEAQIRFFLAKLRAQNAHHLFEEICRHFAQARISRRIMPSTGPVSAGGDGGRDFETFRSYIDAAADEASGIAVGVCTLQVDDLETKIKTDVAKVISGGPVHAIYALCEADLAKGRQQKLQGWAWSTHNVRLEVIDGNALATQLAAPDLRWIAERFLRLPPKSTAREDLRRFLDATMRAAKTRPRSSRYPAPAQVYQPPRLSEDARKPTDVDHSSLPLETVGALLERHQHLVVYAAPGVGKSSLLTNLMTDAVTAWMNASPVSYLPVRIHARHLAAGKPLAEAIRDGAVAELSSKLVHGVPASLFGTAPEPGGRWLVLVDGLDEIQEIERRKIAIDAVADGLNHWPWRFVVATRPLPDDDLAPLQSDCGFATLLPFDSSTVLRFAVRWFEHYGLPDPDRLAHQVLAVGSSIVGRRHGHPALVTEMLCNLICESPHRTLPRNLALLYRDYVELLQRPSEDGASGHLQELQQYGIPLLSTAAYALQCEYGDTPILDLALADAAERGIRGFTHEPRRWRRAVHDALYRTGIVTAGPDGHFTFVHQTMQEYLAAWRLAEVMSSVDAKDRASMVARFTDEIAYNFEMLRFFGTIWQDQGEDPDPLIAALLGEYPDEDVLRLVQRFIADGLHVGNTTVAILVDAVKNWRTGSPERLLAASTIAQIDAARCQAVTRAIRRS
ncbi:NACHT domain-containing protein [Dactylosporangium sp. CA-233914]|uniref:NACHT domain-containing protein n=1 Tax=Dactylosporangium sp. CA-233914 TaxID=3239934 RepID=UPI003D9167A3